MTDAGMGQQQLFHIRLFSLDHFVKKRSFLQSYDEQSFAPQFFSRSDSETTGQVYQPLDQQVRDAAAGPCGFHSY